MRNKPGSGRGSKWQRAGAECSRVLHTRLLVVACARPVGPWVKMPTRMHWRLRTQTGSIHSNRAKGCGLACNVQQGFGEITLVDQKSSGRDILMQTATEQFVARKYH